MNAGIIFVLAFVACATAYAPSYNLDVSVGGGYGKIPYSSGYGLGQYYPYYQGLYSQSRYPYYQQYPYSGSHSYLYGRQYPYYGYQSQSPISSYYGGYPSYYPYYNQYPTLY